MHIESCIKNGEKEMSTCFNNSFWSDVNFEFPVILSDVDPSVGFKLVNVSIRLDGYPIQIPTCKTSFIVVTNPEICKWNQFHMIDFVSGDEYVLNPK